MEKKLQAEYETALREVRFAASRAAAYTAIALILLGVGLDYALYPNMQLLFASVRVGVSILIYIVILAMESEWGKANIQSLSFAWLLLPQIMISWMIGTTDGAPSIYYAGLNFAMYATGIVLAFDIWKNIIFSCVTALLYVVACAYHPESLVLHGAFLVNILFLIMAGVLSAVYTQYNEKARFSLYRLQAEVAEKNTQLEETNKSLAEIKGQMLQQEKMAAIGTLSAGLIHEVNNPVNYCLMAMNIAMDDPVAKTSASLNECLEDAKQGMQRVQQIVSDLKTFAYRNSETGANGNGFVFDEVVDSAIRLVGYEIKGIIVTRDIPADAMVRGDQAAIIGVLVNLFSNAAMAVLAAHRSEPSIHLSAEWEGGRLRVIVRDNGPGIPPENLARVFEPFFTTRAVGQGLGLGLSISYSVIKRHGGTLHAESELGEWTKMVFDLPGAV
jgi:two-component system sensor histidine kinase PhcS